MKWFLTNETTRHRLLNGVLQESILDQVLFTNEALVTYVKLLSSFGKSDHVSMKIELGVSLGKEPPPSHSATILDVFIIGVKCTKNDQKMIREQFEVFPALLQ